jgi:hypothetical protein
MIKELDLNPTCKKILLLDGSRYRTRSDDGFLIKPALVTWKICNVLCKTVLFNITFKNLLLIAIHYTNTFHRLL